MGAPADYIVSYRSEERIAEIADKIRNLSKLVHSTTYIPIVQFIENELTQYFKGKLLIDVYEPSLDSRPAFVTYNPLTLHVQQGIWRSAALGNEDSIYILAHETGHLVLHDHHSMAFSGTEEAHRNFATSARSAEWQANRFADHFLCPDRHVARLKSDPLVLSTLLMITNELAEDRIADFERFGPRVNIGNEGDACRHCNNFTLARYGTLTACTTCGNSYSV